MVESNRFNDFPENQMTKFDTIPNFVQDLPTVRVWYQNLEGVFNVGVVRGCKNITAQHIWCVGRPN